MLALNYDNPSLNLTEVSLFDKAKTVPRLATVLKHCSFPDLMKYWRRYFIIRNHLLTYLLVLNKAFINPRLELGNVSASGR